MQVTKRDGRIMEFNKERIVNAIVKAMMQTSGGVDIDLANKIAMSIEKGLENKDQTTVYEIQDLVEKKLMGSSRKEVAQAYITYRYNRDIARKSKTQEVFFDIISAKSDKTSNKKSISSVNTPAITMTRFAQEVAKPFANNFLLTKEARDAERDGYIDVYNKGYYLAKSINSFQLPLNELEDDEVKNIESILNLIYTEIIILKDEIDGVIGIPAFDYYLAPYVRNTFTEELDKIKEDLEIDIKNNKITDYIKKDVKKLKEKYKFLQLAINRTVDRVHYSIKTFIQNLISFHKEKKMIFSSINFGTNTSPEGRCVIRELIEVFINDLYDERLNFPFQIWKKKKGINYLPEDLNFDLYNLVLKETVNKIPVEFINLDASFNTNEKWKEDDNRRWYYECAILGNDTRVFEDINGEKTSFGKGILSSVILDLPKIAIETEKAVREDLNLNFELVNRSIEDMTDKYKNKLKKIFMNELEKYTTISLLQLNERFKFQASAIKEQFPKLMSGLWIDSKKLSESDDVTNIEEIIKHGVLALGFVRLSRVFNCINRKASW